MSQTESTAYERIGDVGQQSGKCSGRLRNWSFVEIAVVVGAFVVWWPLGLATMFVKWKKGELWKNSSSSNFSMEKFKMPKMAGWCCGSQSPFKSSMSSGNTAFDAYKRSQLERLEEERRKLDQDQKAFADYLNNLRQAKDKEEFDRFMAERHMRRHGAEDVQI